MQNDILILGVEHHSCWGCLWIIGSNMQIYLAWEMGLWLISVWGRRSVSFVKKCEKEGCNLDFLNGDSQTGWGVGQFAWLDVEAMLSHGSLKDNLN